MPLETAPLRIGCPLAGEALTFSTGGMGHVRKERVKQRLRKKRCREAIGFLVDISQSSSWRACLFSAPWGTWFPIDWSNEELPALAQERLLFHRLAYRVCAFPVRQAGAHPPWRRWWRGHPGDFIVFRIQSVDFPGVVIESCNNPDIV